MQTIQYPSISSFSYPLRYQNDQRHGYQHLNPPGIKNSEYGPAAILWTNPQTQAQSWKPDSINLIHKPAWSRPTSMMIIVRNGEWPVLESVPLRNLTSVHHVLSCWIRGPGQLLSLCTFCTNRRLWHLYNLPISWACVRCLFIYLCLVITHAGMDEPGSTNCIAAVARTGNHWFFFPDAIVIRISRDAKYIYIVFDINALINLLQCTSTSLQV